MKGFKNLQYLALTAAISLGVSAQAEIPTGYYDRLEGLSGVNLKKAVKNVARNHTAISYGDDTWEVFLESDTRIIGSQRVWWDMYSNNNVAAPNYKSHDGLNIEHSVANSWWGGTKNDAYKDIVHLNPSNADANSRKSNYPLGEIATKTWDNGVTFVGKPKSGDCGGATYVYEPADEYKGDFARVFFYMFTIYDDIAWKTSSGYGYMYDTKSDLLFKPWAYEMLLRWAKEDPVSQKEIDRNNVIYKHQKNRNPFIDCPELAEHIWGSKKNQPYHFDGTVDPDDPDTPDIPDTPDTPDIPDTPLPAGYWYAVTSTADLNATDSYVIVATTGNGEVMSSRRGSSNKYMESCSGSATFDSSSTPRRISALPADVAVVNLVSSGTGWVLKVSDAEGAFQGYIASSSAKTLTLESNVTAKGTTATITPASDKTVISYGSAGNLEYNVSAPRFLTYTSNQQPVMLYRLVADDKPAGIGTGLAENDDEVVYGIFDINGRKMAAESVSELENGIYIVVSNFGTKKIAK